MTGDETDKARARAERPRKGDAGERLAVVLEHGRWRHFGWVVAGLAGGSFLVWKLGIIGRLAGVALIGAGLFNLYRFVMTLRHPAGEIRVDGDEVKLPRGLCRAEVAATAIGTVKHAFFLRRQVPWARTGPLLIIETSDHRFVYPRDWFASDSDQRRVALALNRRLGRM